MLNFWRKKNATQKVCRQESPTRKHQDGDSCEEETQASRSNCVQRTTQGEKTIEKGSQTNLILGVSYSPDFSEIFSSYFYLATEIAAEDKDLSLCVFQEERLTLRLQELLDMKTYALHIRFAKGWTFIQNVEAKNIPEAWANLLHDEKCNIAHIEDNSTSSSFVQWNSRDGSVMYSMRAKLLEVKKEEKLL